MSDSSKRSLLAVGLILITIGAGSLIAQNVPGGDAFLLWAYTWPGLGVTLGVLGMMIALILHSASILMISTLLAGLGAILYYQKMTGSQASWAYLWTLIPGLVGLALFLQGLFWTEQRKYHLARGSNLILVSLILFVIFGALLNAFDLLHGYGGPVLLIAIGLYMVIRSLWKASHHAA